MSDFDDFAKQVRADTDREIAESKRIAQEKKERRQAFIDSLNAFMDTNVVSVLTDAKRAFEQDEVHCEIKSGLYYVGQGPREHLQVTFQCRHRIRGWIRGEQSKFTFNGETLSADLPSGRHQDILPNQYRAIVAAGAKEALASYHEKRQAPGLY